MTLARGRPRGHATVQKSDVCAGGSMHSGPSLAGELTRRCVSRETWRAPLPFAAITQMLLPHVPSSSAR